MDPGVSMGVGNLGRGRRLHWPSARWLSNRPLKHEAIDQRLAAVIDAELLVGDEETLVVRSRHDQGTGRTNPGVKVFVPAAAQKHATRRVSKIKSSKIRPGSGREELR